MKILTLNPPFLPKYSRQSRSPCVTKGGTFYYPYFLAYATGALEKRGFEVKLVDAVANDWNREKTIDFIKEYNPNLVIVDTSTPSIVNDMEVVNTLKIALPKTHVSLVGTHPSVLSEQILNSCKADSICRGEYDFTVCDLTENLDKNKSLSSVKGLSFRSENKIIHNQERQLIDNLDDLPFVSKIYKRHFGESGIKKYFYASLRWPQITILTARGCPYNCSFCPAPFKNSYRPRSVENVIEELKYIKKELPFVKEIMFEDETFPSIKQRTIELCNSIIRNKIKIRWSANARVNTDLETLKIMRQAGCRLLCVGFESPEQNVLDNINKRTTKDMQMEFMKDSRKAGILINGCFILGLLSDTKESMQKTIEFAKKLNPDTAQFYPLMVYPHTADYKIAKEKGYLKTEDFSKWLTPDGQMATTISRPDLTSEEMNNFCEKARKEFYLRPKYIFMKFVQSIIHPSEAVRTLKAAKIFFKYLK